MIFIKVNGLYYHFNESRTILEACLDPKINIEIPRFCYHEKLSIAGNCRMCLVETDYSVKPVASCAISIEEGMEIFTETIMVKFARESVMEFLLANHPLDCPICDQGGECDLQDISFIFGNDRGRFYENKRVVLDKNMGPFIETSMTRCIHCTKCVRFLTEISGTQELGTTGRGNSMEISSYVEKVILSEISGNIIDLCPVGALTSKPYSFKSRPWELTHIYTIDIIDPLGTNININIRGLDILRVLPRLNPLLNDEWIDDRTRFFYDGLTKKRLLYPYMKISSNGLLRKSTNLEKSTSKLISVNWETILVWLKYYFNNILKSKNVNGFLGPYQDISTIISYKDFFNVIGNSNLYFSSNKINKCIMDFRTNYIFSLPLEQLNKFDSIFFVGFNPRLDCPLFNVKLREVLVYKDIDFYNIGLPFNYTYKITNLGNTFKQVKYFFEGKNEICSNSYNKNILFIIGTQNFYDINSLMFLFNKLKHNFSINSTVCLFNVQNSFISGLDLGFINGINSKSLVNFGKKNILKFNTVIKQDFNFILSEDNFKFDWINSLNLYMGHHGENSVIFSDIIVPSSLFIEKQSYYTNFQGYYQLTQWVRKTPFLIKLDWRILRTLTALYLSKTFYLTRFYKYNLNKFINTDMKVISNNNLEKPFNINSLFTLYSYDYSKLFSNYINSELVNRINNKTLSSSMFTYILGLKDINSKNKNFSKFINNFSNISKRIKQFLPFIDVGIIKYYGNFLFDNKVKLDFSFIKIINSAFVQNFYSIYNFDIISRSSTILSKGLNEFISSKNYIWSSHIN